MNNLNMSANSFFGLTKYYAFVIIIITILLFRNGIRFLINGVPKVYDGEI